MWTTSESNVKPVEIDDTSSQQYVYIRKDIQEKTREDDNGETITYYTYQENLVPKEDWETYSQILKHTENIEIIEDSITDLATRVLSMEDNLYE